MKTIYILLLVGLLASCIDELDQSNPNNIVKEHYYKTLDEVNTSLNSVYSVLRSTNTLGVVDEALRADIGINGQRRGLTSNHYLFNQNFDNTTSQVNSRWAYLYRGIFYANQVLEGIEIWMADKNKEEISASELKKMEVLEAQAHFFRGLFHFWVASLFNNGEIIIRTSVPENPKDYPAKRSTREAVMKFSAGELILAFRNLPEVWTGADLGRATSGAAAAYLGQLYLYDGNYEEAMKWFKVVMDADDKPVELPYYKEGAASYGYELTKKLDDNFYEEHEFNCESIFEVNYSTAFLPEENGGSDAGLANNLARTIAPNGQGSSIGGNSTVMPAIWLIDSLRSEKMDPNDKRNYIEHDDPELGKYLNLPKVVDEFGNVKLGVTRHKRKFPLRAVQTIAFVEDDCESLYYGYPPYYCSNPLKNTTIISYSNSNYAFFKKFTNCTTKTKEDITLSRSGINYRLMRLADIYLMYAECLIKGGNEETNVQEALDYINRIRQRSGLVLRGKKAASNGIDVSKYDYENDGPTYDEQEYAAKAVMDALMWCERPLELCLEGFSMRSLDLKRWAEKFDNREFVKERLTFLSEVEYLSKKKNSFAHNYTFYDQYRNAAAGEVLANGEMLSGTTYFPEIKELKKEGRVVAYIQKDGLTTFQSTNKNNKGQSLIIGSSFFYEGVEYPEFSYVDYYIGRWSAGDQKQLFDQSHYELNFTELPLLVWGKDMPMPVGFEEGEIVQSATFFVKKNNVDIKEKVLFSMSTYRKPLPDEHPSSSQRDFERSALNYHSETQFCYPIPQTELQSNPLINEIIKR